MTENSSIATKIQYKDDSFSLATSTFVEEGILKSQVLNKEDLENITEDDLDKILTLMDDQTSVPTERKGKIIKIDKESGFILMNIKGNA